MIKVFKMPTKISARSLEDFCKVSPSEGGDHLSLSEVKSGKEYKVIDIPQRKEDTNRLLPFDILPGSTLKLLENPSFGALLVKRGGDEVALSQEIASEIKVEPRRERKRHRKRMSLKN